MAIVTISRGSYSKGKEVAEKVAEKLGYECISRDILIEACGEFNVPEVKLVRAIHDAPSILERFTGGKKKFVACFRAALLKHLQKDNVVYHGLAGHFFVEGVSHVLKVRIIAEMEDRVKLEMQREGIPRKMALQTLKKDDEERRKWSRHLYGIDTRDPDLYDMVIHIKKLASDDVVDVICRTVGLHQFRTTSESQKAMEDLALAARVQVALLDLRANVDVSAENGVVLVKMKVTTDDEIVRLRLIAEAVPGVTGVEIDAEKTRVARWIAPGANKTAVKPQARMFDREGTTSSTGEFRMFDWILGAVFVAMSVVAIVQLVLNWGVDDEDEGDSQDKPTNAENPNRRGDAMSEPQ